MFGLGRVEHLPDYDTIGRQPEPISAEPDTANEDDNSDETMPVPETQNRAG
jgi:hypothetical protein